jgi:hypothetical protein
MFNIDTAVDRKQGTRSYAANAYLKNPESSVPQPNVVVMKGVFASKILFDLVDPTQDVKAVGLRCIGGVDWKLPVPRVFPFDLKVNKEIVVSAGELDKALNVRKDDSQSCIQVPTTPLDFLSSVVSVTLRYFQSLGSIQLSISPLSARTYKNIRMWSLTLSSRTAFSLSVSSRL